MAILQSIKTLLPDSGIVTVLYFQKSTCKNSGCYMILPVPTAAASQSQ